MTESNVFNGLNTEQMNGIVEAIKATPEIAAFQFRAKNEWIAGMENRSTIKGFYGAGKEDDSRKKAFTYLNSEPAILLGDDQSASAGEFVLHALAGCITSTFVMHATARGIRVDEISTSLEGDVDLRGLLGLDDAVTPAFSAIRVKINVKADCSDDELDDLLAYSKAHSPITQTLSRPVPVAIERVRAAIAS
jgi:uncharacterized OsmC-like protein